MIMKRFLIIYLMCFGTVNYVCLIRVDCSYSQEEFIEDIFTEDTEYSDYQEIIERLTYLRDNKLDLNRVDVKELCELPWISENLAYEIIEYRKINGRFKRVSELRQIQGMDAGKYDQVREYLVVVPKRSSPGLKVRSRSRISGDLESNENTADQAYYDSPFKTQLSLKVDYDNILHAGVILEKDSGEKRFDDLLLNYIKINDRNNKNQILAGHYKLEMGEGLAFSSPYSARKSLAPLKTAKLVGKELRPSTSMDENKSLFGVAAQICFKIYHIIIFYSNNRLDATVNVSNEVESLYDSGYHRNLTELAKKDRLRERLTGFAFSIAREKKYRLSFLYYNSMFNKRIINSKPLVNPHGFSGDKNYLASVNGTVKIKTSILFGELARGRNGALGSIIGLTYNNNKVLELLLLYRNYNQKLISTHANPLSERGTEPCNEIGYYLGTTYQFGSKLSLGANYDIFRFPWRTYFEQMPWAGDELVMAINYRVIQGLQLKILYRQKNTYEMQDAVNVYNNSVDIMKPVNMKSMGMQFICQPSASLRLCMRLDKKMVLHDDKSHGLLFYQDINLNLAGKFRLYARISYFDTDDYESRVYQFENDVPGVMTSKMLSGTGNRVYFGAVWKLKKWMELSGKYMESRFEEYRSPGSGGNRNIGSFSVQMDLIL